MADRARAGRPDSRPTRTRRGVRRAPASSCMFAAIRTTLERFRVQMDVYTNEVDLHRSGGVERALERARAAGHVFEQEGATWLRASEFGDDKDRVLVKADGSTTYFAGDLAYLVDKLERGFDLAIYVLGADHHGYSARLRAAARGARLRPLAHRDRALPDGAPDRGRRAEAHVQAARRRRAARRADGRHRRRRGALLSRAALARRDDRHRSRPGRRAGPREPRLLRPVRARPHLLDPAARRRDARRPRPTTRPRPSRARRRSCGRSSTSPTSCRAAVELRAPHRVVVYARDLASAFSAFYRDCPVLDADTPERRSSRLALCDATRQVLARALDLVGRRARPRRCRRNPGPRDHPNGRSSAKGAEAIGARLTRAG